MLNLLKKFLLISLTAAALTSARESKADAYYGWSRLTSAEWSEVKGGDAGQCVDVPGGSKQIGTVLAMYSCHNGNGQFFRLKDNNFESTRIAVYSNGDERCLVPEGEGWGYLKLGQCDDKTPRWKIGDDGTIRTATGIREQCMEVHPGIGLMVGWCVGYKKFGTNWQLPPALGNTRQMVSYVYTNECLDIQGGTRDPGAGVLHYSCHGGVGQMFQLKGSITRALITVYQDSQQLCLGTVGTTTIRAVPCDANDSRQLWDFGLLEKSPNGTGIYNITNYRTERCLDASGTTWDVITWGCHGGRNQMWVF